MVTNFMSSVLRKQMTDIETENNTIFRFQASIIIFPIRIYL